MGQSIRPDRLNWSVVASLGRRADAQPRKKHRPVESFIGVLAPCPVARELAAETLLPTTLFLRLVGLCYASRCCPAVARLVHGSPRYPRRPAVHRPVRMSSVTVVVVDSRPLGLPVSPFLQSVPPLRR